MDLYFIFLICSNLVYYWNIWRENYKAIAHYKGALCKRSFNQWFSFMNEEKREKNKNQRALQHHVFFNLKVVFKMVSYSLSLSLIHTYIYTHTLTHTLFSFTS